MAQPTIEELKAGAFALSKILSTHHVKLSSQQCLDVLTRLTSTFPTKHCWLNTDPVKPSSALAPGQYRIRSPVGSILQKHSATWSPRSITRALTKPRIRDKGCQGACTGTAGPICLQQGMRQRVLRDPPELL